MYRTISILISALGLAMTALPKTSVGMVPAGTIVRIRTNETIDSSNARSGRMFTGVVAADITDRDGRVVIPRGSTAELMVRNVSKNEVVVVLESITAGGRRYVVASNAETIRGTQKPGLGKNKRTAQHVGGGALFGTVIGALAGGGKGAAVGALAGGAAGAGVQVLTRGKSVRVPAESVLTFRLEPQLRK